MKETTKVNIRTLLDKTYNRILQLEDDEEALNYIQWIFDKTNFRYNPDLLHSFPIFRQGVYWAHMGRNIGHEEDKHRPVLIIRSEKKSPICTVVPLTSERLNDGYWYHIDLDGYDNTAMVEQLRVISKNRIDSPMRRKGKIATVELTDLTKIDAEIKRMYT